MRNSLLRAIAVGNLAKAREQLDGASLSLREIRDSSHRRWKNGFQLGEKWRPGADLHLSRIYFCGGFLDINPQIANAITPITNVLAI
jgi:hypothetical protein